MMRKNKGSTKPKRSPLTDNRTSQPMASATAVVGKNKSGNTKLGRDKAAKGKSAVHGHGHPSGVRGHRRQHYG